MLTTKISFFLKHIIKLLILSFLSFFISIFFPYLVLDKKIKYHANKNEKNLQAIILKSKRRIAGRN